MDLLINVVLMDQFARTVIFTSEEELSELPAGHFAPYTDNSKHLVCDHLEKKCSRPKYNWLSITVGCPEFSIQRAEDFGN